ncbi:MAG: hypothetical protein CL764_04445 [Chloroflexi bacterium]|nr:hypothetical protein [Chloroflexota bacterium]|tara:strand:+ start:2681 stop:3448 length:768 start_codon:yes stop_codon:yes gene_type:complete
MITFVSTHIDEVIVDFLSYNFNTIDCPGEILCFQGYIPEFSDIEINFLITGSGESRSLVALNWLEKNIKTHYLINIGFSDSTSENATHGHIIISTSIGNLFGYPIEWDLNDIKFSNNVNNELFNISRKSCYLGNIDFHVGKSISVANNFRTDKLKKWINTRKDILSIDNTGYFIGKYAEKHKIPFISITSILNYINENNSDLMKDLDYSPNEKIINKIKIFSRSNFNNKLKVSRSSLNKFIKLFGKEFSSSIKIQ